MTDEDNNMPRIVVGSLTIPRLNQLPDTHPFKNPDELINIFKRSHEAGAQAILFYLYNDETVQLFNKLHKDCPSLSKMALVTYDNLEVLEKLAKQLDFKPEVIFLDNVISDTRDNELINKYARVLKKYTKNIGIYTKEPIGTVSFIITSNPTINIFIIPFNMLGIGVQNRTMLEMIVNSSEGIFYAANATANEKIKVRSAFDYISTHKIHGAIIELEEIELMLEKIKFAKYYLETHDFLQIALEFEDYAPVCEQCGLGMVRYYPPTGGSFFYCPQCESKIPEDEAKKMLIQEGDKD